MESEKQRNRRLYPEIFAIIEAHRADVTSVAIIEDGEVISGRMPADDYKLAWISAEGFIRATTVLPAETLAAHLSTPKSWVKRI